MTEKKQKSKGLNQTHIKALEEKAWRKGWAAGKEEAMAFGKKKACEEGRIRGYDIGYADGFGEEQKQRSKVIKRIVRRVKPRWFVYGAIFEAAVFLIIRLMGK